MVSLNELVNSLKETIQNLGTFSLISIILITTILIILILLEKKLKIKVINKKTRNQYYLELISKLNIKKPIRTLKKVDNITMQFFKERFKIKGSRGYSELNDFFLKKNKKQIAQFCNEMTKSLYSGEKPTMQENQKLIISLWNIIKNNPIKSKKNIKKPKKSFFEKIKSLEKLNKINISSVKKENLKSK